MESLISLINNRLPESLVKYTAIIHATPGQIVVAAAILIVGWGIVRILRRWLPQWIKRWLFLHRRNENYRLLYERVDKLIRPLRLMVMLYFIGLAVDVFAADEAIDTIFYVLYWFLAFWFIYEVVKYLLYAALQAKIRRQQTARRELFTLFLNITKVLLGFVYAILILSKMGVNLTAVITSLGIGGAIIGLGAKDTITNFLDSVRLVSEDAFRQGDWIETDRVEGFVTEMGLTSTKIRTFDNALVTVPNSILANTYVKNWTRRMVGRRIKFHLRIKYTTNVSELERVIYEIHEMLHRHPDIVNENKLRYIRRMKLTHESGLFNLEDKYGVRRTLLVYLDELDEYSMNILVYAFSISVNWEEWLRVKQDVIKKVLKIVEDSELELAIPSEEIRFDPDTIARLFERDASEDTEKRAL
ncbi:mechanosensitive ion channel family protein [Nitratifractor sp.]